VSDSIQMERGVTDGERSKRRNSAHRCNVALFIPTFDAGGAEGQALQLAKNINKEVYGVTVIALRGSGLLADQFGAIPHVRSVTLECRNPAVAFGRLVAVLRKCNVHILHSFLTATHVYSLAARLARPSMKVVIGIRDSLENVTFGYPTAGSRLKSRLLHWILDQGSVLADLAIVNSEAGTRNRAAKLEIRSVIVRNGIDADVFRPDPAARERLRLELGIPGNSEMVGILANCSPYKGYPNFIEAAKMVADVLPNVHFVAIGNVNTLTGERALRQVEELGLKSIFHFLGARTAVWRLLPGLDVVCSASVTEAFSNAIAESMACGVPCVVTDVGDSRYIVGQTGIVVPPAKPKQLGLGIIRILKLSVDERTRLGCEARQRIAEEFTVKRMTMLCQLEYDGLLSSSCGN